ncbi:MAG: GNAT family N-acetyltransferase [Nocardioides sp.]
MTADAVLETDRLVVRDWRPEEADRFFDTYSRWEVARWLGAQPSVMQDRAEADARIERWRGLNAENPDEGRWAVERRSDGVVMGTAILVRLPDGDGELEVGWHLHPDAWGHGYATEAARAVLTRAFRRGVDEVFAVVRPDNAASIAVCHRLGMAGLGRTDRYYGSELELFRIDPKMHGEGPSDR